MLTYNTGPITHNDELPAGQMNFTQDTIEDGADQLFSVPQGDEQQISTQERKQTVEQEIDEPLSKI